MPDASNLLRLWNCDCSAEDQVLMYDAQVLQIWRIWLKKQVRLSDLLDSLGHHQLLISKRATQQLKVC